MSRADSSQQTRTIKSSEIRVGDVVRTHGMRVRIDRVREFEPVDGRGDKGMPGYACAGTVLNLAEVLANDWVPASFLQTRKGDGYAEDRDDLWVVQGNDLASWQVEPAGSVTEMEA
ncbi:MAG: hypothetical protein ACRDRJ_10180 [Streptosporangiaceae bacterium]